MSKITIHNKNGNIQIINKLTYPETINERVNNAIARGMFESLIPVSIKQKRKETRIECSINGMITLNQYFDRMVYKQMFLDLACRITMLIKDCEKNFGSSNNLDLQNDRIFVDPSSRAIKCIYWPIVNNQRSTPAYLFLKQLPNGLNFCPDEDNTYIREYEAFFDGFNPFSINNFERLLLKFQGKSNFGSSYISETLAEEPSGFPVNVKTHNTDNRNEPGFEYDPFSVVKNNQKEVKAERVPTCFCTSCGFENDINDNFCSQCGNRLKKNFEEENVEIHENKKQDMTINTFNETVVLGYENYDNKIKYPKLLRSKTGDSFVVDKPVFRIGKEYDLCELCIDDNTFISRNHADIVTKGDRHFIIDKGSTNKTFVDGIEIPVETEVEIYNGSVIRLANEEFVFSI